MPVVFIHGVPDTFHLWDGVRSQLPEIDTEALALPGFGVELPEGFRPNKDRYVAWIIGQIERKGVRVDIVGHDWGCILALRVASLRPDLIRTVAAGSGPLSPDYEWHQLAKTWQTAGKGEQFMRELNVASLTGILETLGVQHGAAEQIAARVDPTMKSCILELYRSAVDVGAQWQPGLADIAGPALIFWGRNDSDCPIEFAHQMATHIRAARVLAFDCRHWVPLEKPRELATALQRHWASATEKETP